MDSSDARELVRAIEGQTREIRHLRQSVEKVLKPSLIVTPPRESETPQEPPPQVVTQIFEGSLPKHVVHLAFMDPNDPRPTCWEHTGVGGRFTITSYEEDVTCTKCLKAIQQNQ